MVSLKELKPSTAKTVKRVVLSTASRRRPKTKVLINPTTTQVQNKVEVENE